MADGEIKIQPTTEMSKDCKLKEIPSKPKLNLCEKHVEHNKNGANDSTYCTSIFHGTYESEKLKVFIRKYDKTRIADRIRDLKKASRDLAALRQRPNLYEHIIRYFGMEEDENFIYVATEWCICSVEDLYRKTRTGEIRTNWLKEDIFEKEIKNSLGSKQILWQATKGLEYLHCEGIVHRNLKPSNFLIARVGCKDQPDEYKVKLSDFCMSKDPKDLPVQSGMKGPEGWIAPGLEVGKKYTKADYFSYDVFVLGCFFHFVLTNGDHPFGNSMERGGRIAKSDDPVYLSAWNPPLKKAQENAKETERENEQAVFLLKQMIKFNSGERYNLNQVLDSHYFLSEDYYQLYDIPGEVKPGLCVIINQEFFDNPSYNRRGTEIDKNNLKGVFKPLGFDVEIFQNLKAKDLLSCIDNLTGRNFDEYASLIVCILSHGDENVVAGTDLIYLNINDLKYKFKSTKCPKLRDKPKIWIIEACQGTESQEVFIMQPSDTQSKNTSGSNWIADNINSSSSTSNQSEIGPQRMSNEQNNKPIRSTELVNQSAQENLSIYQISAPIMDYLDIRASIPGFQAFRSPNDDNKNRTGSLLISHLCDELENEYLGKKETSPNIMKKSRDLERILNRVQGIISRDFREMQNQQTDNTANTPKKYVKQTIVRNVSLNGKIKFRKARLPGTVTTHPNDRLCFVSTPAHRYFYQSWYDKFDRETLFNLFAGCGVLYCIYFQYNNW